MSWISAIHLATYSIFHSRNHLEEVDSLKGENLQLKVENSHLTAKLYDLSEALTKRDLIIKDPKEGLKILRKYKTKHEKHSNPADAADAQLIKKVDLKYKFKHINNSESRANINQKFCKSKDETSPFSCTIVCDTQCISHLFSRNKIIGNVIHLKCEIFFLSMPST